MPLFLFVQPHRTYKRKTERKVCTPDMLEIAKQRIADGEPKLRIANSFGITEAALRKRLKEGYGVEKLGRFRSIFTKDQEKELAGHCKNLDDSFYGLSFMDLRRAVFQYAEANKVVHKFRQKSKTAGKEWTLSFMKRHKLSLRTPQQTSLARMMGFNRVQMDKFFANLREVTAKYCFRPDRIYNMDETGLSTVPNVVPKVVSSSGKKAVGKISSSERGELTTAVCAISAAGNYLAPALIFKRKRQKPELLNGAPPGTKMFVSDSGYINSDLFLQWLKHFQEQTNASKENPILLILDNHSTHQSLDAVLYCRENGIILLSIPPHSSHKAQRTAAFFRPLRPSTLRLVTIGLCHILEK